MGFLEHKAVSDWVAPGYFLLAMCVHVVCVRVGGERGERGREREKLRD